MPPKKRPAATGASTSTAKRKRVSIGGTSVIGEPDTSETHSSGRPKRSSISEPMYSTTAVKKSTTKTAKSEATKSPTKAPSSTATRGRGRPRKDATVPVKEEQAPATRAKSPSKPVGRPKKSASAIFTRVKSHSPAQMARQALKKATRSPKSGVAPTTKSRGRPKNTTTKAITKAPAVAATSTRADKAGGRPKGTKADAKTAEPKAETDEEIDGLTANESDWDGVDEDGGKQYWLMKAEPESRLENGVDVKFSIDDLMNAEEPEGWDGVRNFGARNNMRGMKKGDLAFFYHSNTKVPGVAGIMEIAEEHSVDESAFDQNSPYYDPKSSRDNPKWDLVHVRFVRKFSELIPLSELRKYGQPGGALQDLGMLKQSRLSVSSVKPREWHFILGLAPDEDLDDEPEEDLAAVRGQIINVQEKVVRDLNGGETMNGYDADSGDEAVKSKLTIASSIGKEDTEVNA